MKKSVFYSFLMAFAMIFSSALVASCGDDDPDPTPAPTPTPTPTPGEDEPGKDDPAEEAKGGTFYYVEAFRPSALDWVDFKTSFVKKGEAENLVSPKTDELYSFDNLPIANEQAKEIIKDMNAISKNFTEPLYKVTTVAVTSYPVYFSATHNFVLKEDATTEETTRPFWYRNIAIFVCDNGTVAQVGPKSFDGQLNIPGNKAKSFLRDLSGRSKISVRLTWDSEGPYLVYGE